MQSPAPLCYDCDYFHAINSRTCNAFPEGIPLQFKPKSPDEFLSVTKIANLFSVNPKTIYRALWSERLPAYKIGKAWRIVRKDLERFKKNS